MKYERDKVHGKTIFMLEEVYNLKIVLILTMGFAGASLFGYFSQILRLSPILGYLIAGYLIGPFSPGFVADLKISEQLAEIGVILMMFGVGLHFRLEDLINVKNIAIPGAIGQTLVATIAGCFLIYILGWSLEAGFIFGLAIGVASTVVLVRQLSDHHLLQTPQGHISVGWLIVEDIITVIILVLVPVLAASLKGESPSFLTIASLIAFALVKFLVMVCLIFTLGLKIVSFIFSKVVNTRSHELFTLTILAITFVIATGSSLLFGTSIALGAFIAGMVIGKTDLRKRVSLTTTPLKDTFCVIFFLAVGMLFNPYAIVDHWVLFIAGLVIILMIKPLAAFIIVLALNHPRKTALTIAVALAQIGEFSFILAEESTRFDLLPDAAYDVIVACSLVSIAINPLLFKLIKLDKSPREIDDST